MKGRGKRPIPMVAVAAVLGFVVVLGAFLVVRHFQAAAETERLAKLEKVERTLLEALAPAPTGSAGLESVLAGLEEFVTGSVLRADVHYTLAMLYRHQGKYGLAIQEFDAAIEAAVEIAANLDGVELVAYANQEVYDEGADLKADHLPARYARALVNAWLLNDEQAAEQDVELMESEAHGSPYGSCGRALLLIAAKRPSQARSFLDEAKSQALALKSLRGSTEEPNGVSVVALASRSNATAEIAFLQGVLALEEARQAPDAETRSAQSSAAIQALDRAVIGQPNDFLAYAVRSEARLLSGDVRKAKDDATRAIAINGRDPAGFLARGRVQLSQGEARSALADFKSVLDLSQGHVDALVGHARALWVLEERDQAIKDLNVALGRQRDHREALWLRAQLNFEKRKLRPAVDDLTRLLSLSAGDLEARRLLADCHRAESSWRSANREYSTLLESNPDDLVGRLGRGECNVELGKFPDAIRDLEIVIANQSPGFADGRAFYLLSRAKEAMGEFLEARDAAMRAIDVKRRVAEYWQARGLAHIGLGLADEAVADLSQARKFKPTLPNIVADLDRARRLQNPAPTRTTRTPPVTRRPAAGTGARPPPQPARPARPAARPRQGAPISQAVASALQRAVDMARGNRHDQAIQLLEQTRASNPDVGPLLVFLAQLYIRGQRFDEALPLLDRAVRVDPGSPDALAARGQLHAQNGRADQALKDFRASLRGDPNNVVALQGMGFFASASRDYRSAIEFLLKAQALQPNNIDVILLLARAFDGAQRYDEGIEAYKRVQSMIQQQGGPAVVPQLMMEQALLEIRAGKLEDAAKRADQVAQLNDNDPLPWVLRAEIAAVQKKKDEAFEAFEKAWKRGFRSQDFIQQTEFYRLLGNSPRYKRLTGR